MIISENKIAQFQTDGYCVLESVIPDGSLELLRCVCASAIEHMDAEMEAQGTDVIGINHRGQRYFIPAMAAFPEVREFTFSDLMATVCRSILGDTVYFKSDQYVVKLGQSDMQFAWHQDSGYAQKRVGEHPEMLTCWCALDDVDESNGTVYLLPTHRFGDGKVVDHVRVEGTNDLAGYFGDDPGEPVIAPAGSIAIFSSLTSHRSGANPTGNQRRVYLAQYTAKPMPGDHPDDANELFP
jgi:ectoine hydroxylase-related dioxygenase (phytanoyl-CoA dioxygenase family)